MLHLQPAADSHNNHGDEIIIVITTHYSIVDTNYHFPSHGDSFEIEAKVISNKHFIELKRNENWFSVIESFFDLPSLILYHELCHRL